MRKKLTDGETRPYNKLWLKPTLGFFQFAKQEIVFSPKPLWDEFSLLATKRVETGINTYLPVFWEAN